MKEELAQMAVERLAEDETLRGGLTDRGYAPFLDLAVALASRLAARAAAGEDPRRAMEDHTSRLRAIVREAVRTAETGDKAGLAPLIAPPLFESGPARRVGHALPRLRLGADPNDNAILLAAVLRTAVND